MEIKRTYRTRAGAGGSGGNEKLLNFSERRGSWKIDCNLPMPIPDSPHTHRRPTIDRQSTDNRPTIDRQSITENKTQNTKHKTQKMEQIFPLPMQNVFTIYSKSGCTYCRRVKEYIANKGAQYIEINCDEFLLENRDEFLLFLTELTGRPQQHTFPLVFRPNASYIGGYNETVFAFENEWFIDGENFAF
jgi:glutaredoxin